MGVKSDGSPDRRHVTATTEAKVTAKVRALERKRDSGLVDKPGKPLTVATWLTAYLETIAPRTVSLETLESTYGPKIRNRVIPYLGKHRLDRLLQPEHHLEAEGLARNTVLQIHRILSRALKVAVKRGRLARNPCTLVDPPRGERPAIEPLTREEVQAILRVKATAASSPSLCRPPPS
jgi:hypothetical protein